MYGKEYVGEEEDVLWPHRPNKNMEQVCYRGIWKASGEGADLQRPGVVFMSGGITYDWHISKPGITELKVGSSENWYSRVR